MRHWRSGCSPRHSDSCTAQVDGGGVQAGGIAAVLFVVGVVAIGRQRWPVALALVVPGLLALLASGLHKYPFAGRLLLFLVPLMLLPVARGAWAIAVALRPSQP